MTVQLKMEAGQELRGWCVGPLRDYFVGMLFISSVVFVPGGPGR